MYKCRECGEIFIEVDTLRDNHDGGFEDCGCCPYCKSEDIQDYEDFKSDVRYDIVKLLNSLGNGAYDVAYDLFINEEI